MQVVQCWDIQSWDGGERHNHRYYVASKEVADEWLEKHPHDVAYEHNLVILKDLTEIEEYKNGEMRKRAMAKLTTEERIVLGLK